MVVEGKMLSNDQLAVLCFQLGQLYSAGMPTEQSVELLEEEIETPELISILKEVREGLSYGETLSQALEKTQKFPTYLLSMIKIGETTGQLDKVLNSLGLYYNQEAELNRALKRVVIYPATMAGFIAIVFIVLVARVLPVFEQVFTQVGGSLSTTGSVLLEMGSYGKNIAIVLAVALVIMSFWLFTKLKSGGITSVVLRPKTVRTISQGRFASAMSMMISSGIPIDTAVEHTMPLFEQSELVNSIKTCKEKMDEGVAFPKAAAECQLMTGVNAGLLNIGFKVGNPEHAMDEVSKRCQVESENQLLKTVAVFEYSLIVILCVSVGIVLLSVMLPLLGIMSVIGG